MASVWEKARPPRFIAEASSNHARDLSRALAFVDAAADARCDAVKFQLFKIDRMFAPEILAQSAKHRARSEWELPLEHLAPIAEHCARRGIAVFLHALLCRSGRRTSPLCRFLQGRVLRIAGDAAAGSLRRHRQAHRAFHRHGDHGGNHQGCCRCLKSAGARDVTLLHCVSAYPTPPEEANLSAIAAIREATGYPVGWSDHTRKPAVVERAVHRWDAAVVEFHLDLDGQGAEYASGHCWLPGEIAPVIARIREAMVADGTGFKGPQPSELDDREWRADPADGMRPLRHIRATWKPAA